MLGSVRRPSDQRGGSTVTRCQRSLFWRKSIATLTAVVKLRALTIVGLLVRERQAYIAVSDLELSVISSTFFSHMYAPVSSEEFAKQMRVTDASFAISGEVFPKDGGSFAGNGLILRKEGDFVVRLTFPAGAEAPVARGGIYTRDDYWRFRGRVCDKLSLLIDHLGPCGPRHEFNGVATQDYDADTLLIEPSGWDLKSRSDMEAMIEDRLDQMGSTSDHRESQAANEGDTDSQPEKPSPLANGVWMHALVPSFPLIHTNAGTKTSERNDFLGETSRSSADTFKGSFDGIEYGLVKRDGDLHVYLFSRNASSDSIPASRHEKVLRSFLDALAFATGQHCWPYRILIRKDGRLILDKLHAVGPVDRTSIAPFSERIGFNAAVGKINWSFEDYLAKASRFFNGETAFSEAVAKGLWLLRAAATKGIPGEITLTSMCVLLESLTGMIFDELSLGG